MKPTLLPFYVMLVLGLGGCQQADTVLANLSPTTITQFIPDASDDEIDEAFGVPLPVRRSFAVQWVRNHAELSNPRVCFELPVVDRDQRLIATQFVLSDSPSCRTWTDLRTRVQSLLDEVDDLRTRTRLGERDYFTLSISAHAFRHPVHDGVKGLPFWMLTRDRLPAGLGQDQAVPSALLPQGPGSHLKEVVRYQTPDGERLFSHHATREVHAKDVQAVYRPSRTLARWLDTIQRKYPGSWQSRIENRRRVWQTHLTGLAEVTP